MFSGDGMRQGARGGGTKDCGHRGFLINLRLSLWEVVELVVVGGGGGGNGSFVFILLPFYSPLIQITHTRTNTDILHT